MSALLSEILPISVFTASLLGSGHCAGMCGPFTFLFPGEAKALSAYHLARGFAYACFGALAGAVGGLFIQSSLFLSLPWLGVLLFAFYFLWLLYQIWTGKTPHIPMPKKWSQHFLQKSNRFSSMEAKAATIGLASVLLPCGWLYSFLLAAVGTHSVGLGIATMLAFWLGTVPALSLGPVLIRRLMGSKRLSPRWSAMIFLCLGLSAASLKLMPWFAAPSKSNLLTIICNPIFH